MPPIGGSLECIGEEQLEQATEGPDVVIIPAERDCTIININ